MNQKAGHGNRSKRGGLASSSPDERRAFVSAELRRVGVRITEHSVVLETIAEQIGGLTIDLSPHLETSEVHRRSHMLRGAVAHVLTTAADIQMLAGKLDALAGVRTADIDEA